MFTHLMADLIEAAPSEPGTIVYEWTIAEKASRIHIYERYEDEAAV